MPIGFFNPIASTAALFSNIADESEGVPEKSFPFKILMPMVFAKSKSVVIPVTIMLRFAGLPSQSGAGDLHHISVIGDIVLVTALIIPVLSNSCFMTVKFLFTSGDAESMIRLLGS